MVFFRPTDTPNLKEFDWKGMEELSEEISSTKSKYLAIEFDGENLKQNFNRIF